LSWFNTTIQGDSWIVVLEDSSVSTSAWPLGAVAVAVVAGVLSIGLFALAAFREGRGQPLLGVLVGAVSALAGFVTAIFPAFFPEWHESSVNAHDIFGPAVAASAMLMGTVVFGVGLSASFWLGARPQPSVGVAGAAMLVGSVALIATVGAQAHAGWLLWNRGIPTLSVELGARVHVGVPYVAPVQAVGGDARWVSQELMIHAPNPGVHSLSLEAVAPGPLGLEVRVVRSLSVEAGMPQGSPVLPLVAGNVWSFESVTSWSNQYLWFISDDHEILHAGPVIWIEPAETSEGLQSFVVKRRLPSDEGDLLVEEWTVYPWNGRTLLLPAPQLRPLPGAPVSDVDFVQYGSDVARRDQSGAWLRTCTLGALPAASCECYVEPPGGRVRLAGPARCDQVTGSTASTLTSAFLALITVGLVAEDPNRSIHHVVVDAVNGPFAAP
jgi:hypothetical protein